jgi:hypothetical protein
MTCGRKIWYKAHHAQLVPILLLIFLVPVQVKTLPRQRSTTSPAGQISGHIYRADTGAPLENVIVELHPAQGGSYKSHRTATDGSYAMGVDPGEYLMTAYRAGFIPAKYGDDSPNPCPSCIRVGPGQRVDAIDLRLVADPIITTMPDAAQDAEYSIAGYARGPVRFSPDGAFLALGTPSEAPLLTKVWIYDMHSKRLVPVTLDMQGLGRTSVDLLLTWADNDTLYIRHGDVPPYLRLFRLSGIRTAMTEVVPQLLAQVVSDVPADVAATFERAGEQHNDRYTVAVQPRPCSGCGERLSVRLNDGTGAQVLAEESNFLFDKGRSLVFYMKLLAPYEAAAIVTFDLKTRQARETFIPRRGSLIDQTPDGTGTVVAYLVQGSCELDDSSLEAELESISKGTYSELDHPVHVCFVKIP